MTSHLIRTRHWVAATTFAGMAMSTTGRGGALPRPMLATHTVVASVPADSELVADVELYYPTDSSHASIPVFMGGAAHWLDVDMGAGNGVLWPSLRQALDAHVGLLGSTRVQGYGGEVPAEQVSVDSVRVGGVTRTSLEFLVMDLETQMHLTPSTTHPIGGLIARDFFQSYDIAFDFPAHRLRLYTTTDSAKAVARTRGLSCVKNLVSDRTDMIVVPLMVNGHRTTGFLDTGARLTTLDWELAQQLGVTPESKGVEPVKEWSGGVGGEIKEYTVPKVRIMMDKIPLRDRVLRFGREMMPTASSLEEKDQPHVILALNSISDRMVLISTSTNQVCMGPAARAKK